MKFMTLKFKSLCHLEVFLTENAHSAHAAHGHRARNHRMSLSDKDASKGEHEIVRHSRTGVTYVRTVSV